MRFFNVELNVLTLRRIHVHVLSNFSLLWVYSITSRQRHHWEVCNENNKTV